MKLRIVTPNQAVRFKITLKKMRKPPSPMTQSLLMMTKTATDTSAERETFDSMVADMDLSSIK